MSFGEYLALGLKHGGYVLGLLTALGAAVAFVALICVVLSYLADKTDDDKEEDEE